MTVNEIDLEATNGASGGPPAESEVQVEVASQWQLMWWKFKKHKLANFG
jgi:hypothetical protein